MRVEVTNAPVIKVTPRDGRGITIYQGDARVTMTSADVDAFIHAVVTVAQQNAMQKPSRYKPRHDAPPLVHRSESAR